MRAGYSFFHAYDANGSRRAVKKTALSLFCALCVLFTAFSFYYAVRTNYAQEIVLNKSFYFLVAEGENVEACLATAQLYGGAGYAMRREGKEYAVYACYNEKQKAESAREKLLKNNRNTLILQHRCNALYLRTRAQKARKNEITGWLGTLEDCGEVLSCAVEGAENGNMNQSALKKAADSVKSVLNALTKNISEKTDENVIICAQSCAAYRDELSEISKTVVFARDLRRIHAAICNEYILLASAYAL